MAKYDINTDVPIVGGKHRNDLLLRSKRQGSEHEYKTIECGYWTKFWRSMIDDWEIVCMYCKAPVPEPGQGYGKGRISKYCCKECNGKAARKFSLAREEAKKRLEAPVGSTPPENTFRRLAVVGISHELLAEKLGFGKTKHSILRVWEDPDPRKQIGTAYLLVIGIGPEKAECSTAPYLQYVTSPNDPEGNTYAVLKEVYSPTKKNTGVPE
jgi:hypothetical protein